MQPDFIQIDGGLIPRAAVTMVDTSKLEDEGYVLIHHKNGISKASHIQAFEALMLLKPLVLEGLRLRHGKGAWIFHNLISHTLMQFVAIGAMLVNRFKPHAGRSLYELAISIHDSSIPMPKIKNLDVKSQNSLAGKKIIMTAGITREDIDGVRHFANHTRSEAYGIGVASYLISQGAEVTVLNVKTQPSYPPKCKVISTDQFQKKLTSGQDLIDALKDNLSSSHYDAALCLASTSSIKSGQISEQKIKAKNDAGASMTLSVIGNLDIEAELSRYQVPILGYNTHQQYFSTCELPKWLSATAGYIQNTQHSGNPLQKHECSPQHPVPQILKGKTVIITSGPTTEALTTTRDVITNFSSGRQGRDLAYAFAQYGARVVYVTGPTDLAPPIDRHILVEECHSARSMLEACERHLPADIFVGVAAVADFRSSDPILLPLNAAQKAFLTLEQNPDILATIGHSRTNRPKLVIGFAAETDGRHILEYAHGKLFKKNADLICANLVGSAIAQRGSANNQITFISQHNEPEALPLMSKHDVAHRILQRACAMLASQSRPTVSSEWPTPL